MQPTARVTSIALRLMPHVGHQEREGHRLSGYYRAIVGAPDRDS